MSRPRTLALLAAALTASLALAGCAEKAQTAATKKHDVQPWDTPATAFTASGWQAGDKTSWEQQLRQRSQIQNEYSRAPAQP
jgi:ABC-type uncharacterized transport system auxiliary subunit